MSQHQSTFGLDVLNRENLQLLQHIDYLEERLSQYENVLTLQETWKMSREENVDARASTIGEWNVWPYSWATAAWQNTAERLQSFHGRVQSARALKSRTSESERVGRSFPQAHCDEGELTLT